MIRFAVFWGQRGHRRGYHLAYLAPHSHIPASTDISAEGWSRPTSTEFQSICGVTGTSGYVMANPFLWKEHGRDRTPLAWIKRDSLICSTCKNTFLDALLPVSQVNQQNRAAFGESSGSAIRASGPGPTVSPVSTAAFTSWINEHYTHTVGSVGSSSSTNAPQFAGSNTQGGGQGGNSAYSPEYWSTLSTYLDQLAGNPN